MKKSAKMETETFAPVADQVYGVNTAIRMLGIPQGRALYFKKKFPKGTRFTIDEWKIKMK